MNRFVFAALLLVACGGDRGAPGDPGDPGAQGDPGPVASPPSLTGLNPSWGSALTVVTITGSNFSATAGDNTVSFNGYPATVISATATELVVQPAIAGEDSMVVVVNVEVANQVSNGLTFELVPSGVSRAIATKVPTQPSGVVEVGGDLYIAAGILRAPSSGLYRMDSNGVVTQIFAAAEIPNAGGCQVGPCNDGPIALATDGTDVYFVTGSGVVRRYDVSEGNFSVVLGGGTTGPGVAGRPSLTFDAAGNLYVLDRNLSPHSAIVVAPDGGVSVVPMGNNVGAIASDGTDLFFTNQNLTNVSVIIDPLGTPALAVVASNGGATGLNGLTIHGSDVVVSNDTGHLLSAPKGGVGGTFALWGDAGGYAYPASGLWANAAGDLYAAQPFGSAVRRIANGQTDAEIVSAGMRLTYDIVRDGNTWYLATAGPLARVLLAGGVVAEAAPDGAILEVNADGTSRVLSNPKLPLGMVLSGPGELTISDCLASTIYTLGVATGTTTDVLTSGDGIGCTAGLHIDGGGDLFYIQTQPGAAPPPSSIGLLTAAGSHTAAYITGLGSGSLSLMGDGTTLYSGALGDGVSFGGTPVGIYSADSTAAGTGNELIPAAAVWGLSALSLSPNGLLYMNRFGTGELVEINPTSALVSDFGSTRLPPFDSVVSSAAYAMGFMDDGTIVVPDIFQNSLIGTAP